MWPLHRPAAEGSSRCPRKVCHDFPFFPFFSPSLSAILFSTALYEKMLLSGDLMARRGQKKSTANAVRIEYRVARFNHGNNVGLPSRFCRGTERGVRVRELDPWSNKLLANLAHLRRGESFTHEDNRAFRLDEPWV